MSYDIIFPLLLKLVKSRWRCKDPGNEVDNGPLENCRHLRSLAQLIVNKLRATDSSISVDKQKVQKYTAFILCSLVKFYSCRPPGWGAGDTLAKSGGSVPQRVLNPDPING